MAAADQRTLQLGALPLVGQPSLVQGAVGTARDAPHTGPYHFPGLERNYNSLSDGLCDCCSDCTSFCLGLWCFCCWAPWRFHSLIQRMGGLYLPCCALPKRHSCWLTALFSVWVLGSYCLPVVLSVDRAKKDGPLVNVLAMVDVAECLRDSTNGCAMEGPEFSEHIVEISLRWYDPQRQVKSCELHQRAYHGCSCPLQAQRETVEEIMALDCAALDSTGQWLAALIQYLVFSVLMMVLFCAVRERYSLADSGTIACLEAFCCSFCLFLQLCRHVDRASGHLPSHQAPSEQPLITQVQMQAMPAVQGTVVSADPGFVLRPIVLDAVDAENPMG